MEAGARMNHWENMYTLFGLGLVMIGLGAALVKYETEATSLVNAYFPGTLPQGAASGPAESEDTVESAGEMEADETARPTPPSAEELKAFIQPQAPPAEAPPAPVESEEPPAEVLAEAVVEAPAVEPAPSEPEGEGSPGPELAEAVAPAETAEVESQPAAPVVEEAAEPVVPGPDELVFPFFPARAFSDYEPPAGEVVVPVDLGGETPAVPEAGDAAVDSRDAAIEIKPARKPVETDSGGA